MSRILILNGPNLNLLGTREPEIYGAASLEEIMEEVGTHAVQHDCTIESFQSNSEGELVDRIHRAHGDQVEFILFNPGAYTHTSIALRDALLGTSTPFIEIHLSNIHRREPFRRHSYLSDIAAGVIVGLGAAGYRLAYQAALSRLTRER